MRIGLLLAHRVPDTPSPLLLEVAEGLRQLGHEVSGEIPEDLPGGRVGPRLDVYLLKSHTEPALRLAGDLAARGARVVNPWVSCAATQDKAGTTRRLAGAGIPVPRTTVTTDRAVAATSLAHGPQVVKPVRGHRGVGVHVVHTREDVATLPWTGAPVLVQDRVDGPGEDLKVYVVGRHVWAVRKPFDATSFSRPGRPVEVSAEVRRIALRCGEVTGLSLYGLDVIEGPDGPVVVDVNYFPGYKGCVGVAGPMTRHLHRLATGRGP